MPNRVSDMDFDEVSTVDVPANQYGLIVLAKRAPTPEETIVPDQQLFDAETGQPVADIQDLDEGTLVADAQGNLFQVGLAEDDDDTDIFDGARDAQLAEVGKSAFFAQTEAAGDNIFKALSAELRKAADDDQREQVLAKAFAQQATELAKAQRAADAAMAIAKAAEDRQLEAQYIEKAHSYNVPVAPEVLGPVLKRMAESMSFEDCAVIAGVLETSGDIFKSFGLDGEADTDDPYEQIERFANEQAGEIGKSVDGGRSVLSKEAATVAFFDSNPREYSALKRGRR